MRGSKRRTRTRAMPPLSRALAYRNTAIPYKFMERWEVSFAEAQELFLETKRLLWLSERAKRTGTRFTIDEPLRILDEMWHTFVLFTPEYEAYCRTVYGGFIHHHPTTKADKDRLAAAFTRDPAKAIRDTRAREDRQWELVLAELGEDTLLKWYVELPLKYSGRFFARKQRALEMQWRPPPSLVALVRRRAKAQAARRAARPRRGLRA
jgi:hypothetical protein